MRTDATGRFSRMTATMPYTSPTIMLDVPTPNTTQQRKWRRCQYLWNNESSPSHQLQVVQVALPVLTSLSLVRMHHAKCNRNKSTKLGRSEGRINITQPFEILTCFKLLTHLSTPGLTDWWANERNWRPTWSWTTKTKKAHSTQKRFRRLLAST